MINVSIYGSDIHGFFDEFFTLKKYNVVWHKHLDSYVNDLTSDLKVFLLSLDKEMFVSKSKLLAQINAINVASELSDFVFVESVELHEWSCLLLRQDYCPPKNNVIWLLPGEVPGFNENIITWHFWLQLMQHEYRSLTPLLENIDYTSTKPLWFDALLGRETVPRTFVIENIQKHKIEEHTVKSIRTSCSGTLNLDQDPTFIWEPGCKFLEQTKNNWIYANVDFYGKPMIFGLTLPLSVYCKTAYSVLSETGYSNSVIMLTEKSAKVMLAKRIFVSFGSRGHLAHLRSIGFRTFDTIFDEGYDQIDNDTNRWQAAWNTLMWLCKQDQSSIIAQAKEILLHNYNHMINFDWRQPVINALTTKLKI